MPVFATDTPRLYSNIPESIPKKQIQLFLIGFNQVSHKEKSHEGGGVA